MSDTTMICYDDKDRTLQHMGTFDSFDDLADGAVYAFYC